MNLLLCTQSQKTLRRRVRVWVIYTVNRVLPRMRFSDVIGALQWCVTLRRIDIHSAVTTMSSFNAAPRVGHLERVKRMYGYLYKMRHGYNRVRTGEPDYSDVPIHNYDWSHSVYYNAKEVIPQDAPTPKGNRVTHTAYFDANLYHNVLTGKALTGVIHFLNQTMIDCYSRKQATVESATFGAEFIAGRTAMQQTKDLRTSLRYLGVPVNGPTYMFGDNKSMITNGSVPHSKLGKRHLALAYHEVRQAVASGMVVLTHVDGELNVADIPSKHWSYQKIWPLLRPLLFWHGDTAHVTKTKEPD